MARFSLRWLFVGVAVAALLSLPLSWLVRQRLETSRQAAKVSHAVEAQTKAPPRIGYGVIGFRVEADFKGVAINEATAKALAENSQLGSFLMLNCPVSQKQVTILNEADFLIMTGSDDEPPIGSLQGYRIANPSKPIRQTNF